MVLKDSILELVGKRLQLFKLSSAVDKSVVRVKNLTIFLRLARGNMSTDNVSILAFFFVDGEV